MNKPDFSRPCYSTPRGYSLVEVLVSLSIGLLVLTMATSFLIAATKLSLKSVSTNIVAHSSRMAGEHLARQIGTAMEAPELSVPNPSGTRFAKATYRTLVGMPGTAQATDSTENKVRIIFKGGIQPQVGDRLVIARPDLGRGALIIGVNDRRLMPGVAGEVELTLESTIAAATLGTTLDINEGEQATVFREKNYEVIVRNGRRDLIWNENPNTTGVLQVVATNLTASASFPFYITGSSESRSLAFDFNFETSPSTLLGGNRAFYTNSSIGGRLISKSGNPMTLAALSDTLITSDSESNPPPPPPPPPTRTSTTSAPGTMPAPVRPRVMIDF